MSATPSLAVRARDVLTCEWTKFRSVRSTYWTLFVATVTPIALSVFVAFTLVSAPSSGPPVDPMLPGLLSLEYAVLAVSVLGVLAFSTEYATGLIQTTFAAVPRRRPVLAAKATCLPEIVGESGLLVDPASPEEIGEGMARIFAEDKLSSELSCKGLARAAGFSWARCARETLEQYQWALKSV